MAAARGKTIIEVTVVGPDRKGVVADITNFIFKNSGNMEKINQNVVRGLFGMQLEASFAEIDRKQLDDGLKQLAKKLSMEIRVHYQEPDRLQNVAIFVSKESHCLAKLLEAKKSGKIKANIPVIIGSDTTLKHMADEARIAFHAVVHTDQSEAENKILQLIDQYNADLIVLARHSPTGDDQCPPLAPACISRRIRLRTGVRAGRKDSGMHRALCHGGS